ncbi:MAG: hypothetical protein QM750_14580 [Rubrivivax sp.]
MTRTEAVTPGEVLGRLLRAAGDDLVLVGGQALAFWVQRYGLVLPADVVAVSADTDFLAPSTAARAAVLRMAAALQGQAQFPSRRALTALVGQACLDIGDDEFINVDVVFRVIGLTQDAVRKRAVRVEVDDVIFAVMHPLDVLRSRLANLHRLVEKQNPKGVMQLALAIDAAREFLRDEAGKLPSQKTRGRHPLQPFVSEIERLAREDAGRKVARRFGLHVADAIDASLIPAGPFWQRKWPELAPLMSPPYAARFSPPAIAS